MANQGSDLAQPSTILSLLDPLEVERRWREWVALDLGGLPDRQEAALAATLAVFAQTQSSESAATAAHEAAGLWDAEARSAANGLLGASSANAPAYRVRVGSGAESSWVDPASIGTNLATRTTVQVVELPDAALDMPHG